MTTRNDVREHLIAVIRASEELPPEDREHLADVFLDELERTHQLVPRAAYSRDRRKSLDAGFQRARDLLPLAAVAVVGLVFLFALAFTAGMVLMGGPGPEHREHSGMPFFLLMVMGFFLVRRLRHMQRR